MNFDKIRKTVLGPRCRLCGSGIITRVDWIILGSFVAQCALILYQIW